MSEHFPHPLERLFEGVVGIAASIGALALGLHFFNKAKNSEKEQPKTTRKS
jgi:hypothetical protein